MPMGRKGHMSTGLLFMPTSFLARLTLMVSTTEAMACRVIPQLTLFPKYACLSFSLAALFSCCQLYSGFWFLC